MEEKTFFARPTTHALIDEIADLHSIVLYVGAGASIERTGLDWAGLCAEMLQVADSSRDTTHYLQATAAATNEMTISSAIAQRYDERFPGAPRLNLTEAIRTSIYGVSPSTATSVPDEMPDTPTYFNERIASLANEYIGRGKQAVIITPNYDGFLIEALEALPKQARNWNRLFVAKFGVTKAGKTTLTKARLDALRKALRETETLTVVHFHGFVGRRVRPGDHTSHPVVSERDYAATRESSRVILETVFDRRNVVVVGSRLTDPPLTHALAATRGTAPDHPRRYVVRPIQSMNYPVDIAVPVRAEIDSLERDRARHLGVNLVSPDYFCQAPQLLEEVRLCIASSGRSATKYSAPGCRHRYETRLVDWLATWSEKPGGWEGRSLDGHEFLRKIALERVRRLLGCDVDELIKIEFWMRWPDDRHRLALAASSLMYLPDRAMVHTELIAPDSGFAAVQAFVKGAPTYEVAKDPQTRWRSYLARPVRVQTDTRDKNLRAFVPVGAITVASSWEQRASAMRPQPRTGSRGLFVYLDSIGALMANPNTRFRSDAP